MEIKTENSWVDCVLHEAHAPFLEIVYRGVSPPFDQSTQSLEVPPESGHHFPLKRSCQEATLTGEGNPYSVTENVPGRIAHRLTNALAKEKEFKAKV